MSTLSSFLVQDRILSVTQVEQTLQRQVIFGGDFATNLLELNLLKEDMLLEYLGRSADLPVINGNTLNNIDPRVIRMLPWEVAARHKIIPVSLHENTLVIAAAAPVEDRVLNETASTLRVKISIHLALEFRLAMALNHFYGIPMSGRLAALKVKHAPEFKENQQPISVPPGQRKSLTAPAAESSIVVETERAHPSDIDSTLKFVKKETKQTSLPPKTEFTRSATPTWPASMQPATTQPSLAAAINQVPQPLRMLSFSKAAQEIETLFEKKEILNLFFEFASQAFDFTTLFVVHGKEAQGVTMTDAKRFPISASTIFVPLDQNGMFENVFSTRGLYLGPPGKTQTDRRILTLMERGRPRNCAILPVYLRGRIILMLYGDSGNKGVRSNRVTRLAEYGRLVGDAFERILVKRKSREPQKASTLVVPQKNTKPEPEPEKNTSLSTFAKTESVKMIPPADMSLGSEFNKEDAFRPTMPEPEPEPLPPFNSPPSQDLVKRVESFTIRLTDNNHIPSNTMTLSPDAITSNLEETTLVSESDLQRSKTDVGASNISINTPERSIHVKMDEEIDHLIDRVLSPGRFDESAAEVLVGMGDNAITRIITHFPGPLNYDRYQESSRLRRAGRHGPLLRLLIMFGDSVVPHLLPLLDSFDSEIRFYATFLLSEVGNLEMLSTLVKRVFDNDRQIRAVAIDIIKSFSSHPEYRWAVQEVALVLVSTTSTLEKKRQAAEVLGELKDPSAIRSLIEMLGSVDGILAECCQRALVKTTFTDFGFSEKRWIVWWNDNKKKHRIDWALNSINHRIEAIRTAAILELKKMTDHAVRWPRGPMDHKQRRELKRSIIQWWEREGRALNPVAEID